MRSCGRTPHWAESCCGADSRTFGCSGVSLGRPSFVRPKRLGRIASTRGERFRSAMRCQFDAESDPPPLFPVHRCRRIESPAFRAITHLDASQVGGGKFLHTSSLKCAGRLRDWHASGLLPWHALWCWLFRIRLLRRTGLMLGRLPRRRPSSNCQFLLNEMRVGSASKWFMTALSFRGGQVPMVGRLRLLLLPVNGSMGKKLNQTWSGSDSSLANVA